MSPKRYPRWVCGAVCGVMAMAVLAGCQQDTIPQMTAPFAQTPPPPIPDFSQPDAWAALPTRPDAADGVPRGSGFKDGQDTALVDVFYVAPTVIGGTEQWNANTRDTRFRSRINKYPIRWQATAFNGVCRVYAPYYRQANFLAAYADSLGGGPACFQLAYEDVLAAFEYYLAHHNQGRPFLLAGHSQGSYLLKRLIRERIVNHPESTRLVAAYLLGMPNDGDYLTQLPVCATAPATGCWVNFNSFHHRIHTADYNPWYFRNPQAVNPLTWRADTAYASCALHEGGVDFFFRFRHPQRVDAQISDSLLICTPRRTGFFLRVRHADYHMMDYNLFYANIRHNVQQRVEAFLASDQANR